jgi:oxygen-independent coproporphyrinogen-3 oxidase
MDAEPLTGRDFLLETVMMGLRLADGIDRASFEKRFGKTFDELFPGLWGRWETRGLAAPPDRVLQLTDRGRLILDSLLGEVAERISRSATLEAGVSWP